MNLFGGKLQFGLPKVEGLSQHISDLFCPKGEVAFWGVQPKFMTGTNYYYLLIEAEKGSNIFAKEEKGNEILLSKLKYTDSTAFLVALSLNQPYIILLGDEDKLGGREVFLRIIQDAWVSRKKCAVYNLFSSNEKYNTFKNDLINKLNDNTIKISLLSFLWDVVMAEKKNGI